MPAFVWDDSSSDPYGAALNQSSKLPELCLKDAMRVTTDAVANVRRDRSAERGKAALDGDSGVFTQEEIEQLQSAYIKEAGNLQSPVKGAQLGNVLMHLVSLVLQAFRAFLI